MFYPFPRRKEEEKKTNEEKKRMWKNKKKEKLKKKIRSIKTFDVSNYDANCVAVLHSALRLRKLRFFFLLCVFNVYFLRSVGFSNLPKHSGTQ